MRQFTTTKWLGLSATGILSAALLFTSCKKDPKIPADDDSYEVPATYSFLRSDSSSVNLEEQSDLINQLVELNTKMKTGDAGQALSTQVLKDMYANTDGNGAGNFSFTSEHQLKENTFFLDQSIFESLYDKAALASDSGAVGALASSGKAGLIKRSNNATILVDENGVEFTQLNQKGLMGAVILYQLYNSYLADELDDAVDNSAIISGKNYTLLEHHADEAFGYFGAPADFKSNYTGTGTLRYWASYSNELDASLGSNDKIMNAFKKMRAAITNKDNKTKNEQRDILYLELEKLTAACVIHYANEVLIETNQGNRLHELSEMLGFIKALQYNIPSKRKVTLIEVEDLIKNKLGENLWNVTNQGLNDIKDFLAARYGFESIKATL